MKVLVLGGCADMAVPLLSLLAEDSAVQEVVLADINETKVRQLAADHGPKFRGAVCDASDSEAVIRLMRGQDVSLSYIGPFYVFESRMACCAIEAVVPYVSIADDYDAYLEVIKLEDAARAAGVKILTGFGNSPGITQVLARKGFNEVPEPRRISVNWCAGSSESVGVSNLVHFFHIFNGTTLQRFDGREVAVKTGGGKKLVEFPAPIGRTPVYYTGHAESVSLPRNLPGLTEVTVHGGTKPNYIVGLVKALSALGLLATHPRRFRLARFFHCIEHWFASPGLDKSVGRVEVHGSLSGRPVQKHFTYSGHIADITSIPAWVAAKWLVQGRFDDRPGGVYAAERLLEDPDPFIAALREQGVEVSESDLAEG